MADRRAWIFAPLLVLIASVPLDARAAFAAAPVVATQSKTHGVRVARADRAKKSGPRELIGSGHRQPEAENLPKKIRRTEGRRKPRQKRFDTRLGICRGC